MASSTKTPPDTPPRRGRPTVADPRTVSLTTHVSVTRQVAVFRAAQSSRVSVSEFINRAIVRELDDKARRWRS